MKKVFLTTLFLVGALACNNPKQTNEKNETPVHCAAFPYPSADSSGSGDFGTMPNLGTRKPSGFKTIRHLPEDS